MNEGNGLNLSMPVAPANYGGGYGDGMFGGNGAWWIVLFLIFGGWGNRGWGNNVGNGGYNGEVQRGFDQSAVINGINGVRDAVTNGNFAMQNAFQNCCCQNQLGIADLKYTIATEACADRNAVSMALRDVLESNNAGVQKILDVMCQDKIDAKNELIANLRQQLQMAQLSASQGVQTAAILANNEAQTAALEQYLAPVPKPAYIVQNPNCCQQNWGCNCGS